MHGSRSRLYLIENDDDDNDNDSDKDNDNDDDNDDNDDKDDYSCNSVNFKVSPSRFCMEVYLDYI